MTTDKQDPSRAAFEAWLQRSYKSGSALFMTGSDGTYTRAYTQCEWNAWQASRKQALNEARETVHCIALQRVGTALECETAIMELLK